MGLVALKYTAVLEDEGVPRVVLGPPNARRWSSGSGELGKIESITLTGAAFTALSPPTGAKAVILILGEAVSLTLKGVTGDTGTALVPATNPLGIDAILPLGSSPSIGILNGDAADQVIKVCWL